VSPNEIEVRAPRPDEADAIAALLNVIGRELYGVDDTTPDEIRAWFDAPGLDPEHDMRVAVLPSGDLAGYADVGDQAELHTRFWIDLRVRTGHANDAVGGALLDAIEARARAVAASGAVVRGIVPERDTATRALYESRGYRLVRHFFRMQVELAAPPPPIWPAGIAVRTFRPHTDERRVYDAHTEAFADHWEYVPDPYEEWEHWLLRAGPFDPELWFLAEDGDELAGLSLCRPSGAGDPELGWLSVLAVRRPWRRRGLGLALLLHTFGEYYRRGFRRVGLGVDAANTTGAVRLYERAGMSVVRRNDTYEWAL
jgi:mycothiol synthase